VTGLNKKVETGKTGNKNKVIEPVFIFHVEVEGINAQDSHEKIKSVISHVFMMISGLEFWKLTFNDLKT